MNIKIFYENLLDFKKTLEIQLEVCYNIVTKTLKMLICGMQTDTAGIPWQYFSVKRKQWFVLKGGTYDRSD